MPKAPALAVAVLTSAPKTNGVFVELGKLHGSLELGKLHGSLELGKLHRSFHSNWKYTNNTYIGASSIWTWPILDCLESLVINPE